MMVTTCSSSDDSEADEEASDPSVVFLAAALRAGVFFLAVLAEPESEPLVPLELPDSDSEESELLLLLQGPV